MKTHRCTGWFIVPVVALTTPTWASFVDTFENGVNQGGWYEPGGNSGTLPGCGNPGWCFFANTTLNVPRPQTTLTISNPFKGNYRAMGITEVAIDVFIGGVSGGSTFDRPLTVFLYSDNGTAGSTSDDWGAYYMSSSELPAPGSGRSFHFPILSDSLVLPPGWTLVSFGGAPQNWGALMLNVAGIQFFFGDPTLVYLEEQWSFRLDNARIGTGTTASDSPGQISPSSLRVDRVSADVVLLSWGASPCGPAAEDYGVYMGTIGNWFSHTALDCHDGGAPFSEEVTAGPGNKYFLVVPFNDFYEGSYGRQSLGIERPQGAPGTCQVDRSVNLCP